MKKSNKSQTTIYYFETIDINQLVDRHLKVLSKKSNITSKTNVEILAGKYEFLIHLICKRYYSNKFGAFGLNSMVLQKIFQSPYKIMLSVLEYFEIIIINPIYTPNKMCRTINIQDPYKNQIKKKKPTYLLMYNKYNKICSETLTREEKKRKEENIKRIKEDAPNTSNLLKTYDRYLKFLRINNYKELKQYLQTKHYISDHQENYYKNIVNHYIKDYKTFNHNSIDNNNRIYSILTSTPRSIKNFLNIKYSIDISNSHPLLFNYFIINKLNISLNILNSFYTFINSQLLVNNKSISKLENNYTVSQNDIENIRNYVCINKKKSDEFARIPNDVWMYILKTSTGRFWDDFKDNFIDYGLDRTDVKQTIFHEVFYSTSTSITAHGKMFAKSFKEVYPNVFQLIVNMKLERKNALYEVSKKHKDFLDIVVAQYQCVLNGGTKHIANDMMKLESKIFFEILEKIYSRRDCKALTIHDAIIVLDTKSKKECNPEVIEKIMRNVYKKYNLYPKFSVDKYDPLKWREEAEREKENAPLIKSILNELEKDAARGKKVAIETLKLINNNEIDIVVEKDNTISFHKLFKHSTKPGVKGMITKKYKQIQKASKKYLKT